MGSWHLFLNIHLRVDFVVVSCRIKDISSDAVLHGNGQPIISHGDERKIIIMNDLLHLFEVLEPLLRVIGLGSIIQQPVDLWVGFSALFTSTTFSCPSPDSTSS